MEGEQARLEARVQGRVQGVGFRMYARDWARDLGLGGFVRNEPDGAVLVVAEGPRTEVERLLDALQRGPAGAHVRAVQTEWGPARGDMSPWFEVRL